MQTDDTFFVPSPLVREFMSDVKRRVAEEVDVEKRVASLRPAFGALLRDPSWLPPEFLSPDEAGGMGGAIGNYLLYRSGNRSLTLMSLVLPSGSKTPVHDHLAWGLVGVYRGEQREWIYRMRSGNLEGGTAQLEEVEERRLRPGDFYDLLPPEGDIHAVQTIGEAPSVSIHLLGNDIGCTWRHRYEPDADLVTPFRSSYSNAPCADEPSS